MCNSDVGVLCTDKMMLGEPDWLWVWQNVACWTVKIWEPAVAAFHRAVTKMSATGRTASVPAGYAIQPCIVLYRNIYSLSKEVKV